MMALLIRGDARNIPLADKSVHCCVTSPPYWGLRDYGVTGQIGLEKTPEEYIAVMVGVFREVRRVLRDNGTLWLNLGDSYAGSWGNYGGQNRSAGKQRAIISGSRVPNPAWDERTKFLPPAAKGFPGIKPKDLIGIPWRVAFALQADGWYLRSDIIWAKPNPMPESVTDRPTRAHEYIFLLSKSARYFYNGAAIEEPASMASLARRNQDIEKQHGSLRANGGPYKQRGHGRRHDGFNDRWDAMEKEKQCSGTRQKRDVWTVSPQPFPEAHFATFPEKLIEPCILAGCPAGGTVLDPFMGSGTTALVARANQCNAVGLDLNAAYIKIATKRLSQEVLEFSDL